MPELKTYSAYRFRTKDPAIDELRTVFQDVLGRKFSTKDLAKVEADGGPSVSCMTEWFFGATRRPQSATLEAAGRAMGYKRSWVKMKKEDQ